MFTSSSESIIYRDHLLNFLENGLHNPLTLMIASTGYGKSVLVSQFIERTNVSSCYFSLNGEHDHLQPFVLDLVSCLKSKNAFKTREDSSYEDIQELTGEALTELLINQLTAVQSKLVIALDNYHIIKNQKINNLISKILEIPNENLHLVIVSKWDPTLNLSSLRSQNRINEIRIVGIAFTLEETMALAKKVLDQVPDPERLQTIHQKTKGCVKSIRSALNRLRKERVNDGKSN